MISLLVSNDICDLTVQLLLAKKGRGLSSLLISKVGIVKGNKRRKRNDGTAEEEKKDDYDEDEMIGDFVDDTSNFNEIPRGDSSNVIGSKKIGTRANHAAGSKKRTMG